MLSPTGMLFVGPSELPLVLDHGFISAGIPMAFACRRANVQGTKQVAAPANIQRIITRVRPSSGAPKADLGRGIEKPSDPGRDAAPDVALGQRKIAQSGRGNLLVTVPVGRAHALSPSGSLKPEYQTLQAARLHADAGRLKEAAVICEKHLQEYGASAEAFYLLGLVLDAQSDVNAIDCYRKALYLEPNHYETLLQMAVLSQRTGDTSRADQYKRRAKRVNRVAES